MCFKGTPNRPSSEQIASVYDKQGAYFNAHTEKRYTCYVVKCSDDHFAESIQVLADMMMKSLFDKRAYTKEKNVVMEETILLNDKPTTILFNQMDQMVYRGSSYQHPIDTVEYHTGQHVLDYPAIVEMYRLHYRPDQMVLSVVSQLSLAAILKAVKKTAFVRASSSQITCRTPSPNYSLISQTGIQCSVFRKPGVQATYIGIGFRTCDQTNPDKYVLDLLKYVLGGYMSSRLYQLLRNDNGLTYTSNVYAEHYEHTGKFMIYASVDHRKIIRTSNRQPGVIPIIIGMLNDLVKQGISADELATAKGFIQGNWTITAQDGDNACIYNGLEYLLYDKPREIVPYMSLYDVHYKDISKDAVQQVIRRYFRDDHMNVVCVGEHVPSESAVFRECSKFRCASHYKS